MVWSGYRPSDDPQTYAYNIPCNMYAAGALERILDLNAKIWQDEVQIGAPARKLAADIRRGIEVFGVVKSPDGRRMYAYEVDGLGGVLQDFDDPNIPSLISIPLLGYKWYDKGVYEVTRSRILSPANQFYFQGKFAKGCGSPHTPQSYIWPLGLMMEVSRVGSRHWGVMFAYLG
jgi:meiotically up-regulated gene 157 (Mug157) protein